jgi:hypothetical protein
MDIKNNHGKTTGNSTPTAPFVIKCISEQCTVVHAGGSRFTAGELDDQINSGTEFGKKLKLARDEVAEL